MLTQFSCNKICCPLHHLKPGKLHRHDLGECHSFKKQCRILNTKSDGLSIFVGEQALIKINKMFNVPASVAFCQLHLICHDADDLRQRSNRFFIEGDLTRLNHPLCLADVSVR